MNIKKLSLISAAIFSLTFGAAQAQTTTVVSDVFPVASTEDLTVDYFGTSGSSALDTDMLNNIGLRSGGSGRQIHGLFETITLGNVGDSLTASLTFLTPATSGVEVDDNNIRIGLFDHVEQTSATQLGQNTSSGSTNLNPLLVGLPGIVVELDVFPAGLLDDGVPEERNINLRQSAPSLTGRLLGTTGGGSIANVSSSADLNYLFAANTLYNVDIQITRITPNGDGDDLEVAIDFSTIDSDGVSTAIGSHTDSITATPSTLPAPGAIFVGSTIDTVASAEPSYNFGMLALGASSGAFGSVNGNNAPDNGIDITSFIVEFTPADNDPVVIIPDDSEGGCVIIPADDGAFNVVCP